MESELFFYSFIVAFFGMVFFAFAFKMSRVENARLESKSKGDALEIVELEEIRKCLEKKLSDEQAMVLALKKDVSHFKCGYETKINENEKMGREIADLKEKNEYLDNENSGLAERVTQQQNRVEEVSRERDKAKNELQRVEKESSNGWKTSEAMQKDRNEWKAKYEALSKKPKPKVKDVSYRRKYLSMKGKYGAAVREINRLTERLQKVGSDSSG